MQSTTSTIYETSNDEQLRMIRNLFLVMSWSLLSAALVLFVKYGYLCATFDPGRLEGAAGMIGLLGMYYLMFAGIAAAVGIVSAVAIYLLSRKKRT